MALNGYGMDDIYDEQARLRKAEQLDTLNATYKEYVAARDAYNAAVKYYYLR